LMKNERPAPTPAVRYTKEMKFVICEGLDPEDMLKACWKPGREGTTELEPWSHAALVLRVWVRYGIGNVRTYWYTGCCV
jgi:hypothetical protein